MRSADGYHRFALSIFATMNGQSSSHLFAHGVRSTLDDRVYVPKGHVGEVQEVRVLGDLRFLESGFEGQVHLAGALTDFESDHGLDFAPVLRSHSFLQSLLGYPAICFSQLHQTILGPNRQ